MESRSSPGAVDIAERVYKECWDEFQTWYSHYAARALRFDSRNALKNLQDEEDFDESVYQSGVRNKTVQELMEPSYLISYHDSDLLELEDDLIQPELQKSSAWATRLTTEPIPRYSSFTPVRQLNYLRGDLWIDETGANIRLTPRLENSQQPEIEVPLVADKIKKEGKGVRKGTIINAEADDNPRDNQESMAFIPPEMVEHAVEEYAQQFHDYEAWQLSSVHWDNNGKPRVIKTRGLR
jgi:hypothetical protein